MVKEPLKDVIADPDITKKVSAKILMLRLKHVYNTYEGFASHIRMDSNSYYRAEHNQRRIKLEDLSVITRAHNMTLSEFFKDID